MQRNPDQEEKRKENEQSNSRAEALAHTITVNMNSKHVETVDESCEQLLGYIAGLIEAHKRNENE